MGHAEVGHAGCGGGVGLAGRAVGFRSNVIFPSVTLCVGSNRGDRVY